MLFLIIIAISFINYKEFSHINMMACVNYLIRHLLNILLQTAVVLRDKSYQKNCNVISLI